MDWGHLPGADLIEKGIADLAKGQETNEALLVSIGAPRLRQLGWELPPCSAEPERRLYLQLATIHGDGAHSQYNALVRRLTSFTRAAACAK
jgi:hypothetical protein